MVRPSKSAARGAHGLHGRVGHRGPPGPVTDVDPARLLAARWSQPGSSGGQVRWTLGDGNGGARLHS